MNSSSFVTYNILADAHIYADRYPRCTKDALDPVKRRALLLDTIAGFDADVYCLQEVEPQAFAAIRARLGSAHFGQLELRRQKPEGAAIFVRRSALEVVSIESVHFRADAQMAMLAHLKSADKSITVASTHLRWQSPETPVEEHVGRRQLLELLEKCRAGVPWIIGGDLNSLSESAVVRAALDR